MICLLLDALRIGFVQRIESRNSALFCMVSHEPVASKLFYSIVFTLSHGLECHLQLWSEFPPACFWRILILRYRCIVLCAGRFLHPGFSAGLVACLWLSLWKLSFSSFLISVNDVFPRWVYSGAKKWCITGPFSLCGNHSQWPLLFIGSPSGCYHIHPHTHTKKQFLKIKAKCVSGPELNSPTSTSATYLVPLPRYFVCSWAESTPCFQEAKDVPMLPLLLENHLFFQWNV